MNQVIFEHLNPLYHDEGKRKSIIRLMDILSSTYYPLLLKNLNAAYTNIFMVLTSHNNLKDNVIDRALFSFNSSVNHKRV